MGFPHGRVVPPMRKTKFLFFHILQRNIQSFRAQLCRFGSELLEQKQITDRTGKNNTKIVNKIKMMLLKMMLINKLIMDKLINDV